MGHYVRYTDQEKLALKQVKLQVRVDAKKGPLAMKLDCPDATNHGGNSDTGGMVDLVLSDAKRPHLIALFNPHDEVVLGRVGSGEDWEWHEKKLESILQGLHVVFRVINSKRRIYTDDFEDYCYNLYEEILGKSLDLN